MIHCIHLVPESLILSFWFSVLQEGSTSGLPGSSWESMACLPCQSLPGSSEDWSLLISLQKLWENAYIFSCHCVSIPVVYFGALSPECRGKKWIFMKEQLTGRVSCSWPSTSTVMQKQDVYTSSQGMWRRTYNTCIHDTTQWMTPALTRMGQVSIHGRVRASVYSSLWEFTPSMLAGSHFLL